MYDQIRKGAAADGIKEDDEDSDQGCTIEEVKNEPVVVEAPKTKTAENPNDEIVQMAEMISGLNVEPQPQFVSDLEELD